MKELMLQEEEQGWNFASQSVCDGCVDEIALKRIVSGREADQSRCDFCGSAPAAPLNVLLKAFVNGLCNEYEPAIEAVYWEGREGGYQWDRKWDIWEIVDDFCHIFKRESLLTAVQEAMQPATWVERDFMTRRRDIALSASWEEFCDLVKFRTRFVFWRLPVNNDLGAGEISPSKILDEVEKLIVQHGLTRVLAAGCRFWRAQTHNEPAIEHSATRLGTVPTEKALTANRMSPAGIPRFYGAMDIETAIREVAYDSDNNNVTWCQFELVTDLLVVDFTRLPEEPSMFDPELGSQQRQIRFLRLFADQLSERVQPEREQIDYVPTQIVTEYLLHVPNDGGRIRGIIYRSSLTGNDCVVLDVPNQHCIDHRADTPGFLKLVAGSVACCPVNEADLADAGKHESGMTAL